MALASLNQDEALEDDFQTQHMLVHCIRWQGDSSSGSSAGGGFECAGGSPGQWAEYCLDIGKEEETLETVNPTWQTTRWLQLAVQGILDNEVPWYKCVTPLTLGAKGAALSLAKCLLTIWQWSLRVQGQDICPPTLTVLNIGQFMTQDEVQGEVDNSLWFEVYSQRVGEAVHGRRWQWPKGKAWEVAVSPIVRAFWEETGMEPTITCTRLCWELMPRAVFRRRKRGTVSHAITFLDDMAVPVPMLDAWDQFIWPPSAAVPWTTTQVEQYGYCCGNTIDLGAVMPAMEFRVTDEEGTYLCMARALIFEGSILVYDPARDEVEWVPTHGVTNDLSWAEERMVVVLANFVPCASQEADHITELGTRHLLAWTDYSSLEEEGEQMHEEGDEPEEDEHEVEGWGESNPKVPPGDETHGWGKAKPEMDPQRRLQEWASIMDDEQPLTFSDPRSDSDHSTLLEPGLLEDAVEVHAPDSELQAL